MCDHHNKIKQDEWHGGIVEVCIFWHVPPSKASSCFCLRPAPQSDSSSAHRVEPLEYGEESLPHRNASKLMRGKGASPYWPFSPFEGWFHYQQEKGRCREDAARLQLHIPGCWFCRRACSGAPGSGPGGCPDLGETGAAPLPSHTADGLFPRVAAAWARWSPSPAYAEPAVSWWIRI